MNSVVRYILALAAMLVVFAPLSDSSAQSVADGTITIVQPKPVLRRQRIELVPRASYTLNDPYTQQVGAGASLHYNVSERFYLGPTFEWFDFGPKLRGTTSRYDEVIDTTGQVPEYMLLDWAATMDFSFIPAYGKFVLFRKAIVYFDVYVTLGGGVVTNYLGELSPAGAVAIGARAYFNSWIGIHAELRDRISVQEFASGNRVWNTATAMVGLNIMLPFKFRYTYAEEGR